MRLGLAALLAIAAVMGVDRKLIGATPTMEELNVSRAWVATHFDTGDTAPPFSFRYDGQPVTGALREWRTDCVVRKLDDSRIERTSHLHRLSIPGLKSNAWLLNTVIIPPLNG